MTVELDFDPAWTAVHRLVRQQGTWIAAGAPTFQPRHEGMRDEPTARARRRANIDRHRHRIGSLTRSAVALDEAFKDGGRLWEVLAYEWQITAPRSRRGRRTELDADTIDRLMSDGKSAKEIAAMYGIHEKTPFNVLNKARKRGI